MVTVDIAAEFSRYPAGRVREDGPYSGEAFREDFLERPLKDGQVITLMLDGTRGYGSSFLEEVFGGLIRSGFDRQTVTDNLKIVTEDEVLRVEIDQYISEADE